MKREWSGPAVPRRWSRLSLRHCRPGGAPAHRGRRAELLDRRRSVSRAEIIANQGAVVGAARAWRGQTITVSYFGSRRASQERLATLVKQAIDAA